ncbi:MAG: PTS sugar transporter subunit IIA, partial [candidate division WOR-3 bacterium]
MENFSLKTFFSPDLIFINDQLENQEAVFHFIADKLQEKNLIDNTSRNEVIELLKNREISTSTGIGNGIAVPHIILPNINKIFGCVVKLDKGIDWKAIDGQSVKLIVFLFAPASQRQFYL